MYLPMYSYFPIKIYTRSALREKKYGHVIYIVNDFVDLSLLYYI